MCGDRPKIIGWLGPSEDATRSRSQWGPSNPYSSPLGQREHVQGVISPQILQNPKQRYIQATIVHLPNT